MRVLHLSRYAEGGAARYASALSDGLYERGIESSILTESKLQTVSKSNQTADLLNRVQSRLFRDVSKTVFHGLNKFGKRDLASALKGFDIVHIHQVTNWIGMN